MKAIDVRLELFMINIFKFPLKTSNIEYWNQNKNIILIVLKIFYLWKIRTSYPKPDIDIEFSKDGYSTIVIKNPNNANIYLERLHISNILEQNIVFCGKDDNAKLNNFEAEFLNNYIANRNDFDFYNKRILFITGSNGGTISSKTEYFENVKEWRERNNKIQTSLFALDKEEVELYEYDAIVLFWVKVFTTKTKNKVLEKSKY